MGECGGTGGGLRPRGCVFAAPMGTGLGVCLSVSSCGFPSCSQLISQCTRTLSWCCCSLDRAEVTDLFNESTLPHLMELLLGPRAEGPYHQVPSTRSSHCSSPNIPLSCSSSANWLDSSCVGRKLIKQSSAARKLHATCCMWHAVCGCFLHLLSCRAGAS